MDAGDEGISHELSRRARAVAAVAWCSFLAASVGTMVCFALVDPAAVRWEDAPSWWTGRMMIYSLGFFFFWFIAAVASTLTFLLVRGSDARATGTDASRGAREG